MRKALVIGYKISGRDAAEYLLSRGYRVAAFDQNPLVFQDQKPREGEVFVTEMDQLPWSEIALAVVSPGVGGGHPVILEAKKRKIEVIGEVELALRFLSNPTVAVTGTNGKTTVTSLIAFVLNRVGKKALAVGNIGKSLTSCLLEKKEEILVVELSSFQLEGLQKRAFGAGVVLNITPDHLNRHKTEENYARAKLSLGRRIKAGGKFFVSKTVAEKFRHLLPENFHIYDYDEKPFLEYGPMERQNLLGAWRLLEGLGVSLEEFKAALQEFKRPQHRMEYVAKIGGVAFYNDSKATNIYSVIYAVGALKGPIILIAGGEDKGLDFSEWNQAFQGKVKKVLAIGKCQEKIQRELDAVFGVELLGNLEAALKRALVLAKEEENVLLSPGCASFDQFQNYEHRGEEFKKMVDRLAKGEK
ncbi:MAG: UDP-N-acetylmuramoyl-L-alanine--D-glutamate ligase [Parachlamydiales bacterium]|jgi:UDP-N-acetylmuramoylalanine--D-glutamate ligase